MKSKGFTIIEVLIAVVIGAILMSLALGGQKKSAQAADQAPTVNCANFK